ncbi:MAG: DoxX family membrane protein [Bacteroidales bacterium]|nr:DoxX family membrane protein [Bacteroidales bacterium]
MKKSQSEQSAAGPSLTPTSRQSASKSPSKLSYREKLVGLITYIFRIAVGVVFIYSGFVKGVDPWGTIYKMREYVTTMHAPWLESQITAGTFLLFSFEFLVGVMLVTGSYRRWAPRLAMLFMCFMLPLTLWIAIADPVADCGCFGDALVISNWTTFWKNVAITAMCGWLMAYNARIRCIIIPTLQIWSVCASIAYILIIGLIGYIAQPLVDYRPYPVGGTLVDSDDDSSEYLAVWSNGEKTVTLPVDSIPDDESWEFVERRQISAPSSQKKSKGLTIYNGNEDVTEDLLAADAGQQVIVFFPSLTEVGIEHYYKLNSLYDYAGKHDIEMFAVAAADSLQLATFRDFSLAQYPIYTAEDTAIKEVVRGNPAVVYVEDGKIVWKDSFQAIPTDDFMKDDPQSLLVYDTDNPYRLRALTTTYVIVMLALIFLSHIPMFLRRLKGRRSGKAAAAVLLLSLGFTSCHHSDEPSPLKRSKLTVLVYMVASNNLSTFSRLDLQEMIQGVENCSPEELNLLVYCVSRTEAPKLFQVRNNGNLPATQVTLKTYANDRTSLTEQRMSQVINDALSLAPADNYGLIFWSHATNWIPASAPAYSFGNDYGKEMNVTDMASAVPDDTFSFVWMDCCLMGSIEMAYEFRNKCDYFVASPTVLLAEGSPYQIMLPALAATPGLPLSAAKQCYEYFALNEDPGMRNVTISVTRTSELDAVAASCRSIAADPKQLSTIGLPSYGKQGGVNFFDFRQTFMRMAQDPQLSADVAAAIDKAVVYKAATPRCVDIYINQETYSGLSVTTLNQLTNSNQLNLYHELDWYKAVYAE